MSKEVALEFLNNCLKLQIYNIVGENTGQGYFERVVLTAIDIASGINWIPVTEPPKDDRWYLIVENGYVSWGWFRTRGNKFLTAPMGFEVGGTVTYWMDFNNLPTPPKQ